MNTEFLNGNMITYLTRSSIFIEIYKFIKLHRALIIELTRRDLKDQYTRQFLGSLWIIIYPLFMMGLYVLIFGFVLASRIGGTYDLPLDYTTYILSGLVPWLCFQQALAKTSTVLLGQSNLIKQLIFPIEVLPIKAVLSALTTFMISMLVLLAYVAIKYGFPSPYYLLLPILIFLQILCMLGVGFIVSAFSLFFRDTKDFVNIFIMVGIYLMPIVYLPNWVPGIFRPILYGNFFSYMVWCYQDALYFGRFEHPWAWVIFSISSVGFLGVGYCVFRWLKPYFGDLV